MPQANALTKRQVAREFKRLVAEYRRETGDLASQYHMAAHPAYQAIIAMGRPVVPLLLKQLRQNPDSWFLALSMITKANPERPADFPDTRQRAEAWLRWGRQHGYIR